MEHEHPALIARRWHGEPGESEEIAPEWFSVDALPLDRMWQDAAHWLPVALGGAKMTSSLS